MTSVRMRLLPHAQDLPLPSPPDEDEVGLDLRAAVPAGAPVVIAPGRRAAIPIGIVIALPPRTEAQIRSRAGLALQHGVIVLGGPQTVSAGYHGELHVSLANLGQEPFTVERGARIACLVVTPVFAAKIEWPLPAEWK